MHRVSLGELSPGDKFRLCSGETCVLLSNKGNCFSDKLCYMCGPLIEMDENGYNNRLTMDMLDASINGNICAFYQELSSQGVDVLFARTLCVADVESNNKTLKDDLKDKVWVLSGGHLYKSGKISPKNARTKESVCVMFMMYLNSYEEVEVDEQTYIRITLGD